MATVRKQSELDQDTKDFYTRTLSLLVESGIPFMLGGAYAMSQYMDFERHTRDLDIFCYRKDAQKILDVLETDGFKTEMMFPHWLGKAFNGDDYVDVIFSSGNGIAEVDDECFAHAKSATLLGIPIKAMPAEDIIWSKVFIMERERFDGADVAHLIRACGRELNWTRLLNRFRGDHWRVLLSHLVLFGFIYPGERDCIPEWVLHDLLSRASNAVGEKPIADKVCQGTLLSRGQYLVDIDKWNYSDGRQKPLGNMSSRDIAHWTAAIEQH